MKAIKTPHPKAEKKAMRFAMVFTLLVLITSVTAQAQIDPSSAMLLNSNRTNVQDGGLNTGRYTVKPKTEIIHTTTRKTEVKVKVEEQPAPAPTPAPTPAAAPTTAPTPGASPNAEQTPPQKAPQAAATQAPQIAPQEPQAPQAAKQPTPEFDVDERRYTMLELSFAPGYLYNESKSTFSPRNYFVSAPAATVDASVWTNPNFGVHTAFTSTLNGNVTDSYNNTKNASASEQWFSAGARARSFFGDGPRAPTLQFGVDYREYEFKVPSDTLIRNKLTTTGLHLLLDAEIPTTHAGSWTLGGEFGPKLSHRETSNAIEFRTGESPEATTVEVHFGARYRFNRTNAMFWKVSYGVERDLFEGSTSVNDPLTGLPQSDVAVTNTFTLFQLGYTWGN